MTRQNPRRPSSSRAPVSRPRRVAGQASVPAHSLPVEPVETPAAEARDEPPPVDLTKEPAEPPAVEPVDTPAADTPAEPTDERPGLAALFDSRRATTVLVALVAVLALAAGGLFGWDALRDDEPTAEDASAVVMNTDDATDGAAAAAKAAETIVATSYQDYDKQVDEAAALMTDAFAKEYRQTAEDARPDVVDAKADIQARVVAQGVVHATRTEVQALVFLNQYVSKDGGDTTYTPYRALVTVVHTDRGWLVSDLDTK